MTAFQNPVVYALTEEDPWIDAQGNPILEIDNPLDCDGGYDGTMGHVKYIALGDRFMSHWSLD